MMGTAKNSIFSNHAYVMIRVPVGGWAARRDESRFLDEDDWENRIFCSAHGAVDLKPVLTQSIMNHQVIYIRSG